MKKLMFAAVTAAVASGAFAVPLVYDYKASVKHVDLKEVSVHGVKVYQKYQKSATLKGYLIVDSDGATSQTIVQDRGDVNPLPAPQVTNAGTATDQGRNRAFLVVQNNSVKAQIRRPKILPAVIEAKWLDTKFKTQNNNINGARVASAGIAEGYLYVGGDAVAMVRPRLDALTAGITERALDPAPGAATPGMASIQDYLWTSFYLFGKYNAPEWFAVGGVSIWTVAQAAIDGNMDASVVTGTAGLPFYHDTWMNGGGIGKYTIANGGDICCGMDSTFSGETLDSLSGNLKGGLFLCTENGIRVGAAYNPVGVAGTVWEEQFFCPRLQPAGAFGGGTDYDQVDLWQDGNNELNTTDVMFGSWSIKRNRNLVTRGLTLAEKKILNPAAVTGVEGATGLEALTEAIKGAAVRLNSNVLVTSNTEIFALSAATAESNVNRVPFITPLFAVYYGLANWQ